MVYYLSFLLYFSILTQERELTECPSMALIVIDYMNGYFFDFKKEFSSLSNLYDVSFGSIDGSRLGYDYNCLGKPTSSDDPYLDFCLRITEAFPLSSYNKETTYTLIANDRSIICTGEISFTLCKEHCGGCNKDNLCTNCKEDYSFLEDDTTTCVLIADYIDNYYYYDEDSEQLLKCYHSCKGCKSIGDVYSHQCTLCDSEYGYEIEKGKKSNCYKSCFGSFEGSNCESFLYFNDKNDNFLSVDFTKMEMKEMIDSMASEMTEIVIPIKGKDFTLEIYSTNSHYKNNNLTKLLFNECENKIIDANEDIIIAKFEHYRHSTYLPQVDYLLYYSDGTAIDTSICKDTSVQVQYTLNTTEMLNLSLIAELSKQNVNLFSVDDPFFNDICFGYKGVNGNDVTLADRRKDFFQNVSLCDDQCNLTSLDIEAITVTCTCSFKSSLDETEIGASAPIFTRVLDETNIVIGKCYKKWTEGKNFPNNAGFWAITAIIFLCVSCMGYFYLYYMEYYLSVLFSNKIANPNKKAILNSTAILKSDFSFELPYTKEDIKVIDEDEDDKEEDLEHLCYEAAIKKDNRSLFQMLWYIFVSKLDFINIVVFPDEYDIVCINISVYLLSYAIDFTLNAVLFSDDVISRKYNNNGQIGFFITFFLSACSNIVGFLLSYYVVKLSTFSYAFGRAKREIKDEKKYYEIGYRLYKVVKIRLMVFFILEFAILLLCIYYVLIFCSVYKGSQSAWIIDCFTSVLLSVLYTLIKTVIVSVLRFCAIRWESKRMYYIARYLNE